jgi:DNA-binding transcriptional LysR family regulator
MSTIGGDIPLGDKTDLEIDKSVDQLTTAKMRVLVDVVRFESVKRAATNLRYDTSTITKTLRELDTMFGPLTSTSRGNSIVKITDLGRKLAVQFQEILDRQRAVIEQRRTTSIRYLPHHSPTVLPAAARLQTMGHPPDLSVLGEHHRSVAHFVDRALRPLVAGLCDVVVGMDIADLAGRSDSTASSNEVSTELEQTTLYRAWLQVMVPEDSKHAANGYITTRDLVDVPLLTAPKGTRSRERLEAMFAKIKRTPDIRIAEYESKVVIIGAQSGMGWAVMPSDVALQFDSSWEQAPLAGSAAARWRWVDLVDEPGAEPNYYNVVAHLASPRERAPTLGRTSSSPCSNNKCGT